jgi:hypothetical protein
MSLGVIVRSPCDEAIHRRRFAAATPSGMDCFVARAPRNDAESGWPKVH